jgi:hypothetical protein
MPSPAIFCFLDSKHSQGLRPTFTSSSNLAAIIIIKKQERTCFTQLTRRYEMNKTFLSVVLVAVVAIVLGTVGLVYAQTPTPQPAVPGSGYGQGMMNGQGRGGMMNPQGNRGGMMNQAAAGDQDGVLHDAMIAVYAQKLGISVDDLNARLAKGETMAQIASSKGLTAEQFTALMTDARSQAIAQAVKDGTLTQAQADWMNQRGAGMAAGGRGGMRGTGQGRNANSTCPYFSQTNP